MLALKVSVPMQGHCIFKPTNLIFDSFVRPTSHADNDGKVLVCMERAILVLGGESAYVGRALAGGERISPVLFALWHPSSHHMYGRGARARRLSSLHRCKTGTTEMVASSMLAGLVCVSHRIHAESNVGNQSTTIFN
jgi:hypothetical protein